VLGLHKKKRKEGGRQCGRLRLYFEKLKKKQKLREKRRDSVWKRISNKDRRLDRPKKRDAFLDKKQQSKEDFTMKPTSKVHLPICGNDDWPRKKLKLSLKDREGKGGCWRPFPCNGCHKNWCTRGA